VGETELERARLEYARSVGVEMQSRRIQDRDGRTIYTMESSGTGDPLIFVHGGGGEGGAWTPLLAALPPGGRYVVVDRPGHGLSYRIDYTGSSYRHAAAEFIEDVLDGLGLERAVLVGNSMGGYFSSCFALAHPQRVRHLVLIGAPAGVDRWIPPMLRLMGLRPFNRLLFSLMRDPKRETLRDQLYAKLLVADASKVPDELLDHGMAAQALPGAEVAWRTLLETVLGIGGFNRRWYIRDDVARLDVPTTFIWGDRDAFAPPSSGQDLCRCMPRADIRVVPNAGHMPWLDAPQICASAVVEASTAHRSETVTEPIRPD
jgi:pimeloyl-ACP methyl ester carboxylesterase